MLRTLDLSIQQLRQDRILDEAKESADPIRLMRLFGISNVSAMRYVATAHRERTGRPLR